MTNLDTQLINLDKHAHTELEGIQSQFQARVDAVLTWQDQQRDALLKAHGKRNCPQCGGTGTIERLDSGYMKRFGLRPWNGCKMCGSTDQEQRGRGYVDD